MSATSAGTRTGVPAPRRYLLTTLMAISVALNLFFVAGALWMRMHPPPDLAPPEQRYRRIAAQLNLDPQQKAAFDRYVGAMRQRAEQMHQEVEPLIGNAWDELAKPAADSGQVMQLFDQASDKRRAFQRDLTTQTIAFLSTLSPAQRQKFVAIARERRGPWFRPRPPHGS